MAQFDITGRVVGFGGSAGATDLPTFDLHYEIVMGNFNPSSGFSQSGKIQTASNDSFRVTIEVPDGTIGFFSPRIMLLIHVRVYVPASNRRDAAVTLVLEGSDQQIYDQIVAASQALRVEVDLTGTRTASLVFNLRDRFRALDNVDELALHLVTTPGFPTPAAAVGARRDGDRFRARLIYREDQLDAGASWLLLHQRTAFPVGTRTLGEQDVGRVFARTWTFSGAAPFRAAADDALLLVQVDSETGVGTISNSLPEQIADGILHVRDLDVDFVNGRIRTRGRVGVGAFGVQLFGIGRFQVVFEIDVFDRGREPFSTTELDEPVSVGIASHTYDLNPDTDLDEFNATESALEGFISCTVARRVRTEIERAIRRAVRDQIDDLFEEIEESLAFAEDPAALAQEIRSTLFLQVDHVAITDDDIRIRAFAGIWHSTAGLAALDCAANVASIMFFSQRPLPMFRQYRRALSNEALQPWMDEYQKHSKELAGIALSNPLLTARLVRLAFDLRPVLSEKGKVPLSGDAVEQLAGLAEAAKKHASPELAGLIGRVMKVLSQGEGRVFGELPVGTNAYWIIASLSVLSA